MSSHYANLFSRYPHNPLLTADHWPYPVNSVFNAGATVLKDGTTLLLCRVEDRSGISHLTAARSENGIDGWVVDPRPTFEPSPKEHPEEVWGVEDPRIVYLKELDQYAITYTSYSHAGPGVSLATTKDFVHFERMGVIGQPEDKDAALLPRKIDGTWMLIHRPVTTLGSHIWSSRSPDLQYWGHHRCILAARKGAWWDANKIGLSPPLIETPEGWLMLYHGVRQTPAGCLYRLGLALFELENPEVTTLRGDSWVFGPEEDYERRGDVANVVFPCGYTVLPDGDTLHLYYGAADTSVCLATASISALLQWLKDNGKLYFGNI
ncbi:MAG: glycosidase [Armatimonadetes bacterium]|nr:glycosidase [Armatimonadota bacterium]